MSSKVKSVTRSLSLPRDISLESERGNLEMVATLQSRKEALEAKILEKNEELKRLCLQEADLTGIMPPEIPLEPGEPPPPIRRRVGTSFSFPQNLINSVKDADDESLTALELECKVQINIAEAALTLANDSSANKAARRKHRLMYRQSQRRLMELETRLNLLKQGKSQQFKSQQIKKKPRPNTTAVDNLEFLWKKNNEHGVNYFTTDHLGSWPGKTKPLYSLDDCAKGHDSLLQNDFLGSLQRSFKTSAPSQSSSSPRTDASSEELKPGSFQVFNTSGSFPNHFLTNSLPHANIQMIDNCKLNTNLNNQKKGLKKSLVRRQWDTQSAGGTLLPSQTYPDHSHQPNLSRTQSLGSVESNSQKSKDSWSVQDLVYEGHLPKEKEWYETSLDSAPSPPLRTTSRLPSTTRMLYQMQELQTNPLNWNNNNNSNNSNFVQLSTSHPALLNTPNMMPKNFKPIPTYSPSEIDNISNNMHQLQLSNSKKLKNSGSYMDDLEALNQKQELLFKNHNNEISEYPLNVKKPINENFNCQNESAASKLVDVSYPSTSNERGFFSHADGNNVGLSLSRQNSLGSSKLKNNGEFEKSAKEINNIMHVANNNLYTNILEDNPDGPAKPWLSEEFQGQPKSGQIAVPQESYVPKPQTPTQPYYHVTKNSTGEKINNLQYQAAKNRLASSNAEQVNFKSSSPMHVGTRHPPHAITQNEISFDTVVPFESPQNHTVVQAGKWQPYREVTKPFEMSDFYKYSTKFRQSQSQANRAVTPDTSANSPNTSHQIGIYTPLKPMTCRPVESKCNQITIPNQMDVNCDDMEKTMVEVSPPEIV